MIFKLCSIGVGMKWYVVMLLACFSCIAYANTDVDDCQATQLRIKPVGQVTVQNQADSKNKTIDVVVKKDVGQETYEQYCTVCHRDGLAGAPKFRNKLDWKPRLTGRTLDDLVNSSIKGLNAMPTKGTCLKCSEDDLKAAITYMLPRS